MEYICIGKIVNTFGIKGELKIRSYSDFDAERYKKGSTVYVLKDGSYLPFVTASYREHKGFPLVSFRDLQGLIEICHFFTGHDISDTADDQAA